MRIAIFNHDGGCGKTTTTANLAKHLSSVLNVLSIDIDSQAVLTKRAGVTIGNNGIGDVMMKRNTIKGSAQKADGEEWKIVGTDIRLEETAASILLRSPNHLFLQRALANTDDYDVVLLDCSNHAYILTANMLYAVDAIIIPVKLDCDSVDDIKRVIAMVEEMEEEERPKILGIVLTKTMPKTVNYSEQKAAVEVLGLPILAEIPNREGVDAKSEIYEAYGKLAEFVQLEVRNA